MIRYWNRDIKMDDSRLTKTFFNFECEKLRGKWSRHIVKLLASIDMEDYFHTRSTCNITICKDKLMATRIKKWAESAGTKDKLRTYRQIKSEYYTENYVKLNLDKNQRSILAQLRSGTLPLHIETGRYVNMKLEHRVCRHCNLNCIEDEYHFLFHCQLYEVERDAFYNSLSLYPNMKGTKNDLKLKQLFTLEPRKLAKFACKIFEKRKNAEYISKV